MRTHPETGRRSLYVGPHLTRYVVGLGPEESEALLAGLYAHLDQPRFVWTHEWEVGDVVLFDNRPTMHRRLPLSPGPAPPDEANPGLQRRDTGGVAPRGCPRASDYRAIMMKETELSELERELRESPRRRQCPGGAPGVPHKTGSSRSRNATGAGRGGLRLPAPSPTQTDAIVLDAYREAAGEAADPAPPHALVALGGYGRREMSPLFRRRPAVPVRQGEGTRAPG